MHWTLPELHALLPEDYEELIAWLNEQQQRDD
jgi:hypothetical protein